MTWILKVHGFGQMVAIRHIDIGALVSQTTIFKDKIVVAHGHTV